MGGSHSSEIHEARADRGESRTAFLTGAATGIGMALARKLDRMGWRVFAGVHRTSPDELTRGASDRLTVMRVDVADPDEFAEAVYTKIISARKLKPVYTLGKGVGYLPIINRVLSQATVERFFRRFFRVKAVG